MTPRIVVLDGYTLSPLRPGQASSEHPSWDALATLGELEIHERTAASEVAVRAAGADIVLTNKVPLRRETLARLPHLKCVAVMATGTNIVDGDAARRRGIVVCNVPGYSTASVAQTVLALLLELVQQTGETARSVREGRWSACPDFSYTLSPWRELEGKILGVIGFGAIGQAVAKIALAMGMRVLVHSRTLRPSYLNVEWCERKSLLAYSDVLTLHCPLTRQTQNLINTKTLRQMKKGALLINTARGSLVDEAAVAKALEDGHLGGYAADVLSQEPPPPHHPLLRAPRTVLTPHLAWASVEARHRLMAELVENVRAFLAGTPRNVVEA